jgi:hypothetical protein
MIRRLLIAAPRRSNIGDSPRIGADTEWRELEIPRVNGNL